MKTMSGRMPVMEMKTKMRRWKSMRIKKASLWKSLNSWRRPKVRLLHPSPVLKDRGHPDPECTSPLPHRSLSLLQRVQSLSAPLPLWRATSLYLTGVRRWRCSPLKAAWVRVPWSPAVMKAVQLRTRAKRRRRNTPMMPLTHPISPTNSMTPCLVGTHHCNVSQDLWANEATPHSFTRANIGALGGISNLHIHKHLDLLIRRKG